MRALLLLLLCASALALNFEASLMSHTLEEMGALDTSQLNCQTPRSHFNELESALGQWQTLLENKERIPEHIQTLTEMKSMIKHKKYEQLVEKLRSLDLVAPPVLAEIEGQLAGLQSHGKQGLYNNRQGRAKTLHRNADEAMRLLNWPNEQPPSVMPAKPCYNNQS